MDDLHGYMLVRFLVPVSEGPERLKETNSVVSAFLRMFDSSGFLAENRIRSVIFNCMTRVAKRQSHLL